MGTTELKLLPSPRHNHSTVRLGPSMTSTAGSTWLSTTNATFIVPEGWHVCDELYLHSERVITIARPRFFLPYNKTGTKRCSYLVSIVSPQGTPLGQFRLACGLIAVAHYNAEGQHLTIVLSLTKYLADQDDVTLTALPKSEHVILRPLGDLKHPPECDYFSTHITMLQQLPLPTSAYYTDTHWINAGNPPHQGEDDSEEDDVLFWACPRYGANCPMSGMPGCQYGLKEEHVFDLLPTDQ